MSTVGAVGLFSAVPGCVLSRQIKNIAENKGGGKEIPWFHLYKLSLLSMFVFINGAVKYNKKNNHLKATSLHFTASFECMLVNVLSHPGGLTVEGVQSGTLHLFS